MTFDKNKGILRFNQPIKGEEFSYSIFVDKQGNLLNQNITICTIFELEKVAHYTEVIAKSAEEFVSVQLDFKSEELKEYKDLDVLVFAQQINKGGVLLLSEVKTYHYKGDSNGQNGRNIVLVIILVSLAIVLVIGGILIFICLRKLKNKPMENVIIAKPTNLEDIESANKGEKMLESMAQSQAQENPQ